MISWFSRLLLGTIVFAATTLQAMGAIVHIQDINTARFASDPSGDPGSLVIPVTSPVAAGHTIIVEVAFAGLNVAPSLGTVLPATDTRGNFYLTEDRLSSFSGTALQAFDLIGAVTNALQPGDSITISFTPLPGPPPGTIGPYTAIAAAQEYSGVSTNVDALGVTSGGIGGTTSFDTNSDSGFLNTTNADDLIYAFVVAKSSVLTGVNFTSSNPSVATESSFQSDGLSIFPAYTAVSATGAYNLAGNIDVSGAAPPFIVLMHALKASVASPNANLTPSKSHVGNFSQGQNGATYQLMVTNTGSVATGGTITVTDNLPIGLSFVSGNGSGWTCSAIGQTVTCTTSAAIAGSASESIALTVNVAVDTPAEVLNQASVSCSAPCTTSGNPASDPTTITPRVLPPPVQFVTPAPALNVLALTIFALLLGITAAPRVGRTRES